MYNTKGYKILSTENILKKVTEYDIFKYYITGLEGPGKKFCSEIREDKNPSCSIKVFSSGKALYKDWASGDSYDCFKYIQHKYNLTYYECLKVISNDFNLGFEYEDIELVKTMGVIGNHIKKQPKYSDTKIRIVSIPFTQTGKTYWECYGITPEILALYNVKQISHYYINNTLISIPKKEVAFSYAFGNYKYKILRPFNKEWKWINNADATIVQGITQLPECGDTLFITKSLKDVMVLSKLKFDAIAPQSENTAIPLDTIVKLKHSWNRVVIYYDNDVPGVAAAELHSELYKTGYIHNKIGHPKDLSDYYVRYGGTDSYAMVKKLLKDND